MSEKPTESTAPETPVPQPSCSLSACIARKTGYYYKLMGIGAGSAIVIALCAYGLVALIVTVSPAIPAMLAAIESIPLWVYGIAAFILIAPVTATIVCVKKYCEDKFRKEDAPFVCGDD